MKIKFKNKKIPKNYKKHNKFDNNYTFETEYAFEKRIEQKLETKTLEKKKNAPWKRVIHSQLKLILLMGGPTEYMNMQFVTRIFFSKNNIEIFSWNIYKMRFLTIYASFRWVIGTKIRASYFNDLRIMFASITPVYAGLMRWAGACVKGLHSANRWWLGSITANVQFDSRPHYLFIPDMNDNLMIVEEAVKRRVAIIAVNSSDSLCLADMPFFGNDKEFKNVVQVANFLIICAKNIRKTQPSKNYSNFFKS